LSKTFEIDNEGVVEVGMHKVLIIDVIYLLCLHDFVLVQQFESHIFTGLLVLRNLDLAESTCISTEIPFPRMRPIS
jgi:hypothetical protein